MNGRFGASLAFAAVAALAAVPWLLVAAPYLGVRGALAALAVPLSGAYLFVIAPRPRQGLQAAILAMALGAVSWLVGLGSSFGPALGLLASALALAVVRSGWLYRRRPARALAVELGLGVTALVAVRFLADATWLSWGVAVWGFFLVQSLFFLVADLEPRLGEPGEDPFEKAHGEARRLLELTGG